MLEATGQKPLSVHKGRKRQQSTDSYRDSMELVLKIHFELRSFCICKSEIKVKTEWCTRYWCFNLKIQISTSKSQRLCATARVGHLDKVVSGNTSIQKHCFATNFFSLNESVKFKLTNSSVTSPYFLLIFQSYVGKILKCLNTST